MYNYKIIMSKCTMYMYNWLSIGDALGTAMLELSAKALTSC